jgi:hypothetical protein
MPLSTTALASTYHPGLTAVAVTGIGLTGQATSTLRNEIEQARSLAQAIEAAIASARQAVRNHFAPDGAEGFLQLPDGLDVAYPVASADASAYGLRVKLFEQVIGRPFSTQDSRVGQPSGLPEAGELSLSEWSDAVSALNRFAAQAQSRLSPAEGGGPQTAEGFWFLNGEPYTLSEVFTAVRMGNLLNLERQIATGLDTINTNSLYARDVLSALGDMLRIRGNKARQAGNANTATYSATTDFKDVIEKARDGRQRTMAEYEDLARKLNRPVSYIQEAIDAYNAGTSIIAVDYASLINEMRTLFDTLNADNQVQQVRVESIQNARNNVLESLSAALKGFNTELTAIRRSLG